MSDERRLPEPLQERAALGELPGAAPLDPETAARLAEDDAAFLAAHPPEVVVPAIRRRLEATRARRLPRAVWLVPVAAAAALALWIGRDPAPALAPVEEGVRFKGDARLVVHRRGPAGDAEPLAPGAVARAGDRLQLAYVAAGAAHGAVVSIDGRGGVTLHFPLTPDGATALAPDGPTALPRSYELDDAPEFERFVLVTSDGAPVPVAAVLAAARALAGTPDAATAPLSLPADVNQTSFLVYKAAMSGPESLP
jgi:hypothetical protein